MSSQKDDRRIYILYDGRACNNVGTEDASVLVTCESNNEAKGYKGDFGMMACYSYKLDGKNLTNERWEWDYLE